MPINRIFPIRYKTLDSYLPNPYCKWNLNELVEACYQALYKCESIDKRVNLVFKLVYF
ncbi:hypothetical protein [Spirosoma linguale]|uniref:Uncharacterized protein n=1 Tax=Spirosoma linguale (strain ATCC 33905 / DSM 74 / LMG 10896 / Claus 1) TaxID=504472 RepID=D2QIJ9_SPILD|nr:hypothetical protein Slin_2768 [Spirosoma linguale DSM 74]